MLNRQTGTSLENKCFLEFIYLFIGSVIQTGLYHRPSRQSCLRYSVNYIGLTVNKNVKFKLSYGFYLSIKLNGEKGEMV